MAIILLVPVAYRLAYRDTIFPGVSINGVSLGGLRPQEAVEKLSDSAVSADAPVTLSAADRTWSLNPGQSGLSLDLASSLTAAYAVGRGGNPTAFLEMIATRIAGHPLPAVVVLDEATAQRTIADLAATFDREPVDASVRFDDGAVTLVAAKTGLRLDQTGALAALAGVAHRGQWPVQGVDLPFTVTQPVVSDASPVIQAAESLLAQPIRLRAEEREWSLAPEDLAPMLTSAVRDGQIVLEVQAEALRTWLLPVTQSISRTATLPRFRFDPEAGALALIEPGVPGLRVDVDLTAAAIVRAAQTGHGVDLALKEVAPLVADASLAQPLGIRELIHSETSRFSGSPRERIHNIGLAAARYDGLLIPPDGNFSFNEHLGDVSAAEGYQKTKIIMDGATADGIGGGVCQVSTTVFRAAFWSGLPILERQAHGYRVGYYEQGSKPGLDATIYSPIVDFKFRNDTGHWLLIQTQTDPVRATVTFAFYGTRPPGRTVHMDGPFETGRRPPPPARVTLDHNLAPGAVDKVELPRWGSTFRVVRIVSEGDQERREEFLSHYRPTGEITRIGPQVVALADAPPGGGQGAAGP